MTFLEEYFTKILDNKINSCEKMKLVAEKILNDFYNPNKYHFDVDIANRHIDFIETFCKTPSGKINTPLKLELFQKARLEVIFGFVDDNDLRKYNEVLIIEGRKNGKTTECAAIELDLLINDFEGAPEIYNIATTYEQANKGFQAIMKMRNQSPILKKHTKKRMSDLYYPPNMGTIKVLSSRTSSLDGLDVHGAIIDELSAIRDRDLYDLVKQGTTARQQPLLFTITTNGFYRNGIFDTQYEYATQILNKTAENEHFLPFIYELDSIDEWDKEECWIKANPGLGTIKDIDKLKELVQKSKDDPASKPSVLVKDFNMKQTGESRWLRYEELNNEEIYEGKFKYCIGGFDAADTTDLNAATVLFVKPNDDKIYRKSMYWIPESVLEMQDMAATRRERDNAPYRLWIEQGYMRTCPGNKCDKIIFLNWFKEIKKEFGIYTVNIGYDPWHIDDSLLREFAVFIGKKNMLPIRQGVYTLSDPMKELKADLAAKKIVYDNNPIDKWCLMNTEIKTDVNGNIQPIKGKDPRLRIDGTIALLNAYTVLRNKRKFISNLNKGM